MNRFVRWRPCWSRHAAIVPLVARRRGPVVCVPRARAGAVLSFALAVAGVGVARAQPSDCYYTWTAIPNPPGYHCQGKAINSHGHVAGDLASLSDSYRGFLWTPQTGTVVLPMPPGVHDLRVNDLNDHGHIVGWMSGTMGMVAFLWDGAQYTIIPRPDWANGIEATALNNHDQVVGTVMNNLTGPLHAFFWELGIFTDIGAVGSMANSWGDAINECGSIAGHGIADGLRHGFVIADGLVTMLPETNGLRTSQPAALSDNGIVAGWGQIPVEPPATGWRTAAVVWAHDVIALVPPPSGAARFRGVNRRGRAVGYYGWDLTAIAWQSGQLVELRQVVFPAGPPGALDVAQAINESGQIVVWGGSGTVLLNPVWRAGDLTGDCRVTLDDLAILLAEFGSGAASYSRADVDLDGDVDLTDLTIMLANWSE